MRLKAGRLCWLTTHSSMDEMSGREKATCSRRVGVTVMVAATRSPRPSVR